MNKLNKKIYLIKIIKESSCTGSPVSKNISRGIKEPLMVSFKNIYFARCGGAYL